MGSVATRRTRGSGRAARLANRLGVHRSTVIRWRDGATTPTHRHMLAIAHATNGAVGIIDWLDRRERADDPPSPRG